jgi:hypothetical protein
VLQRNNPEKAKEPSFISGLLENSKDKEGPLTTRILQKYGVNEMRFDGVKAEL